MNQFFYWLQLQLINNGTNLRSSLIDVCPESLRGARVDRTSEEGIRAANKHFQQAAGFFEYIREHILPNLRPKIRFRHWVQKCMYYALIHTLWFALLSALGRCCRVCRKIVWTWPDSSCWLRSDSLLVVHLHTYSTYIHKCAPIPNTLVPGYLCPRLNSASTKKRWKINGLATWSLESSPR